MSILMYSRQTDNTLLYFYTFVKKTDFSNNSFSKRNLKKLEDFFKKGIPVYLESSKMKLAT